MTKPPRKPAIRKGVALVLFVPTEAKEALTALGVKHDRNLSQEIVAALRAWLAKHGRLPVKNQGNGQ